MLTKRIIKYVEPPRHWPRSTPFWPPTIPKKWTEEEVNNHITTTGFKVGDWVVFNSAWNNTNNKPNVASCSVVADIQYDVSKIPNGGQHPKTFLLMQLSGCSEFCRKPDYAFSRNPWSRWDDGLGMILVPEDKRKEFEDDYVQNYIKEYLPNAANYCHR